MLKKILPCLLLVTILFTGVAVPVFSAAFSPCKQISRLKTNAEKEALALPNANPGSQSATSTPTYVIPPTLPANLAYQTATPGLDGTIKHTVLEGQFLITIAEMYGISLNDLLANNNLTADSTIFPGDILIIKKGVEPTLALPTPTVSAPTGTLSAINTPQAKLGLNTTADPIPTQTEQVSIFKRVFTNNTKFLALGILALVILGLILLVISSRRIQ